MILLGLALYSLLLVVVPQIPESGWATDRWLSQAQDRFGRATEAIFRLGLFRLSRSPVLTLLCAGCGFALLIRTARWATGLANSLHRQPPRLIALTGGANLGPLLLLVGLLVSRLSGWRAEGLVGRPGETLSIAGHGEVRLTGRTPREWVHDRGLAVYVTGEGPELTLQAYGVAGNPLGLQRAAREGPAVELTVRLLPDLPEAYFAIPEAGLVGRLALAGQGDLTSAAPLRLQVFRSPTGEQVQEATLVGETSTLTVDGTRLEMVRSSYLVVAVAHDPGRWWKGVGLVVGAVGIAGTLAWTKWGSVRGRWFWSVFNVVLAVGSLAVAGLAGWGLWRAGLVWDNSWPQAVATGLWLAGLAGWLGWRPGRDGQVEHRGGGP